MTILSSQSESETPGFAKTASLDLDLTKGKSLKKVPSEVKDKAIKTAVEDVCGRENLQYSIDFISGSKAAMITCGAMAETAQEVKEDAERVYKLIIEWLVNHFNEVLESETGGNRSDYYRTTTFFESSIENGIINIYWS